MVSYTNSAIRAVIDEHIHHALYREILKDRYIDGLTYEQIAERHDLSVRWVKAIVYRHENQVFDHLP